MKKNIVIILFATAALFADKCRLNLFVAQDICPAAVSIACWYGNQINIWS